MSRILLIDDSPSVLALIESILVMAGHQIVTCRDGRHGAETLKREAFDLIVTDIYMPNEDGLEVIRERNQYRPNVPIVAMSGMTGQRSMLKIARHLGASQTLQKPFSSAELLKVVDAALSGSAK